MTEKQQEGQLHSEADQQDNANNLPVDENISGKKTKESETNSVEDAMGIPEQKAEESVTADENNSNQEIAFEEKDESEAPVANEMKTSDPETSEEIAETAEHFTGDVTSEENTPISHPVEEMVLAESESLSSDIKNAAESETSIAAPEQATAHDEEDELADDDHERDVEMDELESSEHYTDLDKGEIIKRMEELAAEQDPEPVRKKFFALRRAYTDIQKQERDAAYQAFISEGGSMEDYKMPEPIPLDEKLRDVTGIFKDKLTEKREKREREKQENLTAKKQVIEELKAVIQNEENILHAFDKIHELQAKWRSIGIVPLDQAEDLWQSYRFYVGKFYDLIRIHKELQELDQKRNLEAKIILCGQAEDLLLEPSINKAITELRHLQDKWRDIGPVPKENNEEIWDRFKSAADTIYDRRRGHIEELKGQQEVNLAKKIELCEKAEAVANQKPEKPGDWQNLTEELKTLQQEWKQVGPAPRQQNEKIWQRFRAAGDKHFNDKKDYFSTLKKEQDINKQRKIDLCVQAEALKESTEWKETAETLKKLQDEWKAIGPVHPKYSQKLWERFRAACDAFFTQRAAHNSELEKEFTQNLELKTALVEQIEAFETSGDKSQDLEKLKDAQRQWSEIGRVPIKMKDKIYQRYRRALDKCYEKLNLSSADRRNISSNNRIKQMEQEGRQLTQKDKSSVRYKIDRLQDEIRLLENNIGFFANSKQASKLKEDYERKIEQAKSEVQNLKALLAKS